MPRRSCTQYSFRWHSYSLYGRDIFTGTATAIHVTASGMSLSGNRLLGVFILGSANGNDDHPEDHGWSIVQDPNGGTHNYVSHVYQAVL